MNCDQAEATAGEVRRLYSLYYDFLINIVFRAQLPVKEKIFRLVVYMKLHDNQRASLLQGGRRELWNDYLRVR